MMDDLIAFLRAALDEDEQVARAATPGHWSDDPTGTVCADADLVPDGQGGELLPPTGPMEVAECYRNEQAGERGHNAAHVARHDPARVLAEVAAKRQIIDECAQIVELGETAAWLAEFVLKHEALPYAGRDGYREEWRP